MIRLALDVPGQFYREAITKALERTGQFNIGSLEEYSATAQARDWIDGLSEMAQAGGGIGRLLEARDGPPDRENAPEVALLGVSVQQGYTLKERTGMIKRLRSRAPNCRIVLFLDELVSPEQTNGVKNLRQARLIDGFLYASGTMEYLVATLESI